MKYLVATNINEWFIFDASLFEKLFAQNKTLVKQFHDFENGRLAGTTTDFFYREIASPFIAAITQEIEFTYFDFRTYEKPLRIGLKIHWKGNRIPTGMAKLKAEEKQYVGKPSHESPLSLGQTKSCSVSDFFKNRRKQELNC